MRLGPHSRVITLAWADSRSRAGLAWLGRGVPTPAQKFHRACRFFEAASLLAGQSGLRLSRYARLGQWKPSFNSLVSFERIWLYSFKVGRLLQAHFQSGALHSRPYKIRSA